jgi:hypothetical protein
MPGPLLGAVVINLGAPGVADPSERLERVYEWRMGRATGWLRLSAVALAVTLAPLLIDVATAGDAIDGTGRFFLAVAVVAWCGLIAGINRRLQRLEEEYATAQALLAAVRAPSGTPPGRPAPQPVARPAPAAPSTLPPAGS